MWLPPRSLTAAPLTLLALLLPPGASAENWSLLDLSRKCDAAATICAWTFAVENGAPNTSPTPCSLVVTNASKTPADQVYGGPSPCGPYQVTSGWSGQFGPSGGFSTISVFVPSQDKIAWFSYTDLELKGGQIVTPNHMSTVTSIPKSNATAHR